MAVLLSMLLETLLNRAGPGHEFGGWLRTCPANSSSFTPSIKRCSFFYSVVSGSAHLNSLFISSTKATPTLGCCMCVCSKIVTRFLCTIMVNVEKLRPKFLMVFEGSPSWIWNAEHLSRRLFVLPAVDSLNVQLVPNSPWRLPRVTHRMIVASWLAKVYRRIGSVTRGRRRDTSFNCFLCEQSVPWLTTLL